MKRSFVLALSAVALVFVFMFFKKSRQAGEGTSMHSCPPGYYYREGTSTWAGWEFNCLPIGQDSSLVAVPEDTNYNRAGTMYAPIVAGTQLVGLPQAQPANLNSYLPKYK
jgi:hypothetical protein